MIYCGQEVGTPQRLTFPFTSTKIDWSLNPELTAEYKKLIAFRNESIAIRRSEPTSHTTDDVCAFTKQNGKDRVFVIVNVRNRESTLRLPGTVSGKWNDAFSKREIKLKKSISLQPYEYLVLKQGE